jgi:DNA-binding winged helix-turn-helix (wHTH) protein/tetratricopeptide (TPR) repeat protein
MEAPVLRRRVYRFGLFQVDAEGGRLFRQGVPVKLQQQPLRVLCLLLERPGEIVSREELRQSLWPEGTYVEFDGSLNAALKRLRYALGDDADNPTFIETVPKRGYRFVAPVAMVGPLIGGSEQVVADSASAVPERAEAVEVERRSLGTTPPQTSVPQAGPMPPSRQRPVGRVLLYGMTLGVILLAAFGWYSLRQGSRAIVASDSNPAHPIPSRKSVAVWGFYNVSGRAQDDWLGTAFSEMLSTELASGEKLRIVSGEEVASLRISSPWSQTSTLGRETTARIGTALNTDLLVLGSYMAIGQGTRAQLRLDVRLQDTRTGEVLSQFAQTGNANDLFQVASDIGAKLRERLGVHTIRETDRASVLASLPLDREAARFYALGITKLREFDALAAKDLLVEATKADPKFSLAHLMLARAWNQLGYEQKRKEEAKVALDLSTGFPRVDRMQVEGDYYESLGDHEKAASSYRTLFELFPDSVEYGLQLAASQTAAGHAYQALDTIGWLRRLPPPASDDPRIDMAEARAVPSSRRADSLTLVRSAATKSSAQGKKLLYASARLWECMNLVYGEHRDQANLPCEDAYDIYRAAGNNLGAADALRLMADQQGGAGHIAQARSTYQRALKILGGTGEHLKTAVILNNMGIGYTNEGDLDRGEQCYRLAKFHFEQAGDKQNTATALSNIADILYLRGNLQAAAKTYEKVIEIRSSLDGVLPGYAHYRLADLELAQGRVPDAHRLAQQAVDAMRQVQGDFGGEPTGALSELGDVLKAEGDLKGARQQYGAALEIRQKMGETSTIAESQVTLADLSLEEGHADQVEPLLRAAIAEFEKEKSDPDTASGYLVLSRALLAEGKLDEAREAVKRAAELTVTSPDPAMKLPIAIQTARVERGAALKARDHALVANSIQKLRSLIASAKKLGYYEIECEARLDVAEAELRIDPARARSQLEILEKETHTRGLEFLSHKAQGLIAVSQPSQSARSSPSPP